VFQGEVRVPESEFLGKKQKNFGYSKMGIENGF